MKYYLIGSVLAVTAFSAFLSSCGVKVYSQKDFVKKEIRISQPFDTIVSYGTTDIEFVTGEPNIELSAPKQFIDRILISIEDNKLIIKNGEMKDLIGTMNSKLKISYDSIKCFKSFGTSDINIQNLATSDLSLLSYGVGDFECGFVKTINITLFSGGTGDFDINKVECSNANLITLGTGDITVKYINASDSLYIKTEGTGDVAVSGKYRYLKKIIKGTGDIDVN